MILIELLSAGILSVGDLRPVRRRASKKALYRVILGGGQ
jgi:hypothetical protein